jgi:serine/threonine protein kinase
MNRGIGPSTTDSSLVGGLKIIHKSSAELNMDEPLKLSKNPEPGLPLIGYVQLMKCIDEAQKIYEGLDLLAKCFVLVRILDKSQHMNRLKIASRLQVCFGDYEKFRRIKDLLLPPETRFELHNEKLDNGGMKLNYYWFEKAKYGSLHAYVKEKQRLSEIQAQDYFRQICNILEFCHERNIILEDFKLKTFVFTDSTQQTITLNNLDSLLICPETNSLVIDNQFNVDQDQIYSRMTCPIYTAPEVLNLKQKEYSGKARDIWALGVLLYTILLGKYPFYDRSVPLIFDRIKTGIFYFTPYDKSSIRIDARLLIRSMLRFDPTTRPTIHEILKNHWVNPKEYLSSFKTFDRDGCVF